jgi:glycosyltransferase involved in cell wall biosynthesis
MRICIITDAWLPQVNGVVTTMRNLVSGLQGRGHQVMVVHPGLFNNMPCPTYPEIRLAIKPYAKLAWVLDAYRPQAIHITAEGPLGLAGRRYCLRRKKQFTSSICTRFPEYVHLRSGLPVSWLYKALHWFHAPAKRTMVATPSLMNELETKGFKGLAQWGRGVDLELFKPGSKESLPGPRPISLYLGRVAVEKNLDAFLSLDLPGSKVVIGDGPALRSLMRKYPETRFLGRKTGPDLARHLAGGDVFVFPSLTDTFGVVLIEAMACGLPAAAFPVTGPKDVIIRGQTGWLDDDLCFAVHKALKMDPAKCRAHAVTYSWQNSLDQFESNLAPAN